MPFPAFISQYMAGSADTVAVAGGSGGTQTIPNTRYYFLISPKTTVGDGQSLLKALGNALTTASGSSTYAVVLTSDFKVKITAAGGSTTTGTITITTDLAIYLGFYPLGTTGSTQSILMIGATSTASFRSPLFWSPEMVISATGPDWFDPAWSPGISTSAGAAQRSPDMTASYVSNGVQIEGDLIFNSVQPYWRVHPQSDSTAYTNQDYYTWWKYGPRVGRRYLFWRDRLGIVNTSAPVITTTAPPCVYVEYNPSDRMRAAPLVKAAAPPNLVYWDVTVSGWLTERGETIYFEP